MGVSLYGETVDGLAVIPPPGVWGGFIESYELRLRPRFLLKNQRPPIAKAVSGIPIPRPTPSPTAIELSLESSLLALPTAGIAVDVGVTVAEVLPEEGESVVVGSAVEVEAVEEEVVDEVSEDCTSCTGSSVKYDGESVLQSQLSLVPKQQNPPEPQALTPTALTAVAQIGRSAMAFPRQDGGREGPL